ncbi:regulatory iron-sulfur-containing complex subunit RicT [Peptococcus simiae]|uniref:Regulatory iron-sulfur-containing complex subunit RicT n=1 Tax=Peptococcus simiae TaxID=1643805 RepID=A0ABW9H002_9FIRM
MTEAIAVQLRPAGKIYDFAAPDLPPQAGSKVVVETDRGLELGTVVKSPHQVDEKSLDHPLQPIVREATVEDLIQAKENEHHCAEAFAICEEKIQAHGLDMKLIEVERTLDGNKLIFNFTAEERVDFRDLVKDLASIFHTRIELRQIGVRDEAKLIGGVGICGRTLCCHSFMTEFSPVSIKMAKEQNLSLNPSKISGCCGRLLCCLNFENDNYLEWHKTCPGCTAADVAAKMRAEREAEQKQTRAKDPFAHMESVPIAGESQVDKAKEGQHRSGEEGREGRKGAGKGPQKGHHKDQHKDRHNRSTGKGQRPAKKTRPQPDNGTEIIIESAEPIIEEKRPRKNNRPHQHRGNRKNKTNKPPRSENRDNRKEGDRQHKKRPFSKGKAHDKSK